MAYENLELVVAAISGEIYLARMLNDGTMSTVGRREITAKVLRAATEWFIANDKRMIQFEISEKNKPALYYTNDESKKERILAILKEDEK